MKAERCRVTEQGQRCPRPVVGTIDGVPVCATHKAEIDARVQAQIREWAAQLARGASVDELRLPGEK